MSPVASRYHQYTCILHKYKYSSKFLDLYIFEKLKIIEEHHNVYIVMVVGKVDVESQCKLIFIHSIVIKVDEGPHIIVGALIESITWTLTRNEKLIRLICSCFGSKSE